MGRVHTMCDRACDTECNKAWIMGMSVWLQSTRFAETHVQISCSGFWWILHCDDCDSTYSSMVIMVTLKIDVCANPAAGVIGVSGGDTFWRYEAH